MKWVWYIYFSNLFISRTSHHHSKGLLVPLLASSSFDDCCLLGFSSLWRQEDSILRLSSSSLFLLSWSLLLLSSSFSNSLLFLSLIWSLIWLTVRTWSLLFSSLIWLKVRTWSPCDLSSSFLTEAEWWNPDPEGEYDLPDLSPVPFPSGENSPQAGIHALIHTCDSFSFTIPLRIYFFRSMFCIDYNILISMPMPAYLMTIVVWIWITARFHTLEIWNLSVKMFLNVTTELRVT